MNDERQSILARVLEAITFDRIKVALLVLFFVAVLVLTGSAQKDVLQQRDPAVLNFMANAYCPGIVQAGQGLPMSALDVTVRGLEDYKGLYTDPKAGLAEEYRDDPNIRLPYAGQHWEALAAERHQAGAPGYHQSWKVRFVQMPAVADARGSWALTRLMGGMAPEFMYSMATPEYGDTCHRWFVDLSPYLNRPNPYVPEGMPGHDRWLDAFYPGALSNWHATYDKHIYCIPVDQVEIAVFYNADILRACGIDPETELPPRSWAAFLDLQRRIQEKGYVAFQMPASDSMRLGWMHDIINDMLYAGVYDQLNTVNDPDIPDASSVDSQEKIRALRLGLVSLHDDRYWEAWRIIKEWSRYWQPGATGTRDNLPFVQGRAALTVDGSWFVQTLEKDQMRTFEYGTFFLPPLTDETTPFAHREPDGNWYLPRGVGGATATQYSITVESAQRKEALEAAIDLLMWVSAPQHLGPMVAENGSFLPTVRGAALAENLRFMQDVLDRGPVRLRGLDDLDQRCKDAWWACMQYYLSDTTGTWTRERILATLEPAVEYSAQDQMDRYKEKWEWVYDENGRNTWEIVPPRSILDEEFRQTHLTDAPATQEARTDE